MVDLHWSQCKTGLHRQCMSFKLYIFGGTFLDISIFSWVFS